VQDKILHGAFSLFFDEVTLVAGFTPAASTPRFAVGGTATSTDGDRTWP
jgi:hypothetical protein